MEDDFAAISGQIDRRLRLYLLGRAMLFKSGVYDRIWTVSKSDIYNRYIDNFFMRWTGIDIDRATGETAPTVSPYLFFQRIWEARPDKLFAGLNAYDFPALLIELGYMIKYVSLFSQSEQHLLADLIIKHGSNQYPSVEESKSDVEECADRSGAPQCAAEISVNSGGRTIQINTDSLRKLFQSK